jgi:hypothetical protein
VVRLPRLSNTVVATATPAGDTLIVAALEPMSCAR